MIIVDSHQDLAWNMLTFQRDYTRSASETRRQEAASSTPALVDDTLLGWADYMCGHVALIFSTIFASPRRYRQGVWESQCYADRLEAVQLYSAQLDAYHRLANDHPDKFRLVLSQAEAHSLVEQWDSLPAADKGGACSENEAHPNASVGLVVLMEGAEMVGDPSDLEEWWERGVRLIGPAWAGTRFCGGTNEPGPMTKEGFALLEGMAEFGFGLDLSHMDERAALQAIDVYPGELMASHSNAQALLRGLGGNRHLSDRAIRGLTERGGVIGVMPYNLFLKPGWKRGEARREVTLHDLVAHIDHICQIAGDAHHAAIGSDFDGGFGLQSAPAEIDTIADLHKIHPLLAEKGYSEDEIAGILGKNWLDWLMKVLPAE